MKCICDWYVDGTLVCKAGKEYEIRDASETEGEDSEGYYDVLGCEDGRTLMTNCVELSEYFE